MAVKQLQNSLQAPDGSYYVTLTDGAGNLDTVGASSGALSTSISQSTPGSTNNVTVSGNPVTYTDRSGTITLGATAQTLAASNPSRKGFIIQNNGTATLWFNTVATAVQSQPSIQLISGGYYESPEFGVPTQAISIIGPTTGQTFSAREW